MCQSTLDITSNRPQISQAALWQARKYDIMKSMIGTNITYV